MGAATRTIKVPPAIELVDPVTGQAIRDGEGKQRAVSFREFVTYTLLEHQAFKAKGLDGLRALSAIAAKLEELPDGGGTMEISPTDCGKLKEAAQGPTYGVWGSVALAQLLPFLEAICDAT
jgi:hypothetical protein